MAEGFLQHICGHVYDIYSAGTKPSAVRPEAVTVLAEMGIDISHHRSKSVDEFAGRSIDFVLTVCDNARANCPYIPAGIRFVHHAFPDPAEIEGNRETRLSAFREVRDMIRSFLTDTFIPEILNG
jgi:arsenate reductase (thioredoxin)